MLILVFKMLATLVQYLNISGYKNFSKYNELIHIFEGKEMKTHLHVG